LSRNCRRLTSHKYLGLLRLLLNSFTLLGPLYIN
jgi:hypothetical protein